MSNQKTVAVAYFSVQITTLSTFSFREIVSFLVSPWDDSNSFSAGSSRCHNSNPPITSPTQHCSGYQENQQPTESELDLESIADYDASLVTFAILQTLTNII